MVCSGQGTPIAQKIHAMKFRFEDDIITIAESPQKYEKVSGSAFVDLLKAAGYASSYYTEMYEKYGSLDLRKYGVVRVGAVDAVGLCYWHSWSPMIQIMPSCYKAHSIIKNSTVVILRQVPDDKWWYCWHKKAAHEAFCNCLLTGSNV